MARKIGYAVRPIADIQADLDELGNRLSRVATFIRDKVQRAVVYAEPAGHNNRYLLAQARGETRHAELAVSELIDQADKKIDDIKRERTLAGDLLAVFCRLRVRPRPRPGAR